MGGDVVNNDPILCGIFNRLARTPEAIPSSHPPAASVPRDLISYDDVFAFSPTCLQPKVDLPLQRGP